MNVLRKNKVTIGVILILAIALVMTPILSFGSDKDQGSSLIGKHVTVDAEGNVLTETDETTVTTPSGNGTEVVQSKTITATDTEDLFKVNLSVTTDEIRKYIAEEDNKDIYVFVLLDSSGSMIDNLGTGNMKMTVAKNTLLKFSNDLFSEMGDRAYMAFGTFSKYFTLRSDWNNRPLVASDFPNPEGGTNMQDGFDGANRVFSRLTEDCHKVLIVVGDGDPTLSCDENNNLMGNARDDIKGINAEKAREAVERLKSQNDVSIYTVGINLAQGSSGESLLRACASGDEYFATNDASGFVNAFDEIYSKVEQEVTYSVKPWHVTDPMSKWVTFEGFDSKDTLNKDKASIVDGKITWNLDEENVVANDNGTYTYSLSYFVKLNKKAEGFESGKYYPTNGITTLDYTFTINGDPGASQNTEFLIPTVRGFVEEVAGETATEKDDSKVLGEEKNPVDDQDDQKVLGEEAKTSDAMNMMPLLILVAAMVIVLLIVAKQASARKE